MTARPAHQVARLDFTASVGDVDLAFALRPRLERLAWELMPAAMERLFDEAGPADAHLRIDRLDLDLGAVRPDHLEEDALAALSRALAEALAEALHSARYAPSDKARLIDPAAVQIDDFETYLVWGRLPAARSVAGFDAGERLRILIAEQPQALAAMLRRLGRDRDALERLLLQAGDAGFRQLLELLAPRDSAVILALLADTLLAHRERPIETVPRLTEPALDRLLRLATLEFLLSDPGSQFNRRRFLGHLLQREAAALGIDYPALLRLLADSVAAARARTGFRSSLPTTLAELLSETRPEAAGADEETATAIAAAQSGTFDALLALVRRRAADRPALDALLRRLSAPLFAELVERLRPADSAPILAMLDELLVAQSGDTRSEPIDARLEPTLRSLALLHLIRDPPDRFDRRRFLGLLLEQEATLLPALYSELADALEEAPAPHPAPSDGFDLEAALAAALGGDLEPLSTLLRARAANAEAFLALVAAVPDRLFARLLRRARPSGAAAILGGLDALIALHRDSPLLAASDSTFARLVRATGLRLALAGAERRFSGRTWLLQLVEELAEHASTSAKALRRALAEAVASQTGAAGRGIALIAAMIRAEDGETVFGRPSELDLILRAIESGSDSAAAALLAMAGDPARLLRLAARLDARKREWLLVALDRRGGAALAEDLRLLERLHSAAPLLAIDGPTFAQLLWAMAAGYIAERGGARFDRSALGRHLTEGIARFAGRRPSDFTADLRDRLAADDTEASRKLAADYFGERAEAPERAPAGDDARRSIEQYLRTGRPVAAGRGLAGLAASDRAWLAATVRRLARAAPGQVPMLSDRLLAWLLPEELLECLSPGAGRRAARLADSAGVVDPSAWRSAVAAVLDGKAPPFPELSGGAGRRLDRIALLAHWLDHETAAWWAPDDAMADALLADLPGLTFAELDRLFGGPDSERGFARLWRAIQALSPDLQSKLIERLAPWATRPGGAPAAALDRLDPRRRLLALTRAAADSLAGREPDLTKLAVPAAEPASPPPPAPAMPPAGGIDSARLFAWLDGAHAGAAEAGALVRHFARLADSGDSALAGYLAERRGRPRARARWASLLPPEALGRLVRLLVPSGAQAWLDSASLLAAAARQGAAFGSKAPDPARVWTVLLDLIAPADSPTPARGVAMLAERLAEGDPHRAGLLRARALRLAQQGGHVAVAAALRRADPGPVAAKRTSAKRGGTEKPAPGRDRAPADKKPPEPKDAIFIGNAGLVLLNPYLPSLFERLGLLTETGKGPRLVGLEAISRGVHLLQYIAEGRCDRPEPLLVLNKLLCGVPPAQPIEASIEPSEEDLATCDSLIAAIIANWPSIANSSPAALRETFLQREGKLLHGSDGWKLHVQRKTVDVLVDRIPWSFAMVYHRWMAEPVQVTW